jgi:hypothetical protein
MVGWIDEGLPTPYSASPKGLPKVAKARLVASVSAALKAVAVVNDYRRPKPFGPKCPSLDYGTVGQKSRCDCQNNQALRGSRRCSSEPLLDPARS